MSDKVGIEPQLKLNPSSLPYVKQCPCWVRKKCPPNEAMLRGTKIDTAFRAFFQSGMNEDTEAYSKLNSRDKLSVSWAANVLRSTTDGDSKVHVLKKECKFKYILNGVLISGEMDAWWPEGVSVFDLKTGREHDYVSSMDAYAYYVMRHLNSEIATTTLLYCDMKLNPIRVHFLRETEDSLATIIDAYKNPNKEPIKSHACNTCTFCNDSGICTYSITGVKG